MIEFFEELIEPLIYITPVEKQEREQNRRNKKIYENNSNLNKGNRFKNRI